MRSYPQQGVMSAYQLTNHDHSSEAQGGNINPMADVGIGMNPTGNARIQVLRPLGGSVIDIRAGDNCIPGLTFMEGAANRIWMEYDTVNHEAVLQALGEDADITLRPNGTGKVKFGTHVGLAAEVLSGYIIIQDSAGNPRKVGVIS